MREEHAEARRGVIGRYRDKVILGAIAVTLALDGHDPFCPCRMSGFEMLHSADIGCCEAKDPDSNSSLLSRGALMLNPI